MKIREMVRELDGLAETCAKTRDMQLLDEIRSLSGKIMPAEILQPQTFRRLSMAFESLSDKLQNIFKNLRGKGRLSEADVKAALKEVKDGTSGSTM